MLKKLFFILLFISAIYADLLNISEQNKDIYNQVTGKWSVAYEVLENKFTFDINISTPFFDKRVGGYIVEIYESEENIYLCSYNPMSTLENFNRVLEFFCLQKSDYELNYDLKNFVTFNIDENEQILIGKMGLIVEDTEIYSYSIIGNKQIGEIQEERKTLKLKEGWNLISLPVATEIHTEDMTSFPPQFPADGTYYFNIFGKYEDIWIYDKKWIQNPKDIYKAQGIWIKMSKDTIIYLKGKPYFPDLIGLKSGWHLMGTGNNIENLMAMKSTEYHIEDILIYSNGEWIENPETIKIGDGFWIKKVINYE